jgi:predicted amidophosphoribosyltransferase
MQRCPLCRAMLNRTDSCRRCKAELATVLQVDRESRCLAGAAMHRLAVGDTAGGRRLLRRALDLHATPETQALWRLVGG